MPGLVLTWVLLAIAVAMLLFAVAVLCRGIGYRVVRPLRLRVGWRNNVTPDIFSFNLQRPWYLRWKPLPRFCAGQSVQLRIPGLAMHRRYSLARWQAWPFAYEFTIRSEALGRFSPQLATHVRAGAWLKVSPPDGEFLLLPTSTRTTAVLIAGGVGITPLLAMLDAWCARTTGYRQVHLYWQVRHAQEAHYRQVLAQLAQHWPGLRVRILVSQAPESAERISLDVLQRELGQLDTCDFYLCAGAGLLDSLLAGLRAAGVPEQALHYERFGLGAQSSKAAWTVHYANQALSFDGHPSILDALEAHQLDLDADCRTGSCGRCLLRVVAGQAQHRIQPEFYVPDRHVLACCAVPMSELSLQLPTRLSAGSVVPAD